MTGGSTSKTHARFAAGLCAILALAACENSEGGFNPFKPRAEQTEGKAPSRSTKMIERDIEAPEVFQVTEEGLWDGRPSLGGVWVAHPTVSNPERVIIRNEANGKFVIGALFKREISNPGPKLQVSSDAAAAIGMIAGQPAELSVTALRRENVPDPEDETEVPQVDTPTSELEAPTDVQATPLDPVDAAAAAIAKAETVAPAPAVQPTNLSKPYVQLGIFSVEANANKTADLLRANGISPLVKKQNSKGKTFWRVIAGPAANSTERSQLLKKVKALGYADAYAVSN